MVTPLSPPGCNCYKMFVDYFFKIFSISFFRFSRLASGIISPSELPDSPSQSMPQTPRNPHHHHQPHQGASVPTTTTTNTGAITSNRQTTITAPPPPLRSVFEDDVNTFGVEHTPAQFSCATSLSNLSLDDEDETKIAKEASLVKTTEPVSSVAQRSRDTSKSKDDLKVEDLESKEFSEGEESANDDDLLLANCINIGMNRGAQPKPTSQQPEYQKDDTVIKYCTEDTPAILSKQGSNTNLSILSMEDGRGGELSDDSSNCDQDGHDRLLEECIRDGMTKTMSKEHPISMLRTTGLPPYLAKDEMNRFNVEDSPCNFSTMSALSNLTIDSENVTAGLANNQR